MSQVEFNNSDLPLSESDIKEIEIELGITFPIEYKNFLLLQNGGRPTPGSFPLVGDPLTSDGTLDRFLCIDKNSMYDVSAAMSTLKDRIPSNFLTIGVDPGGNFICLSFKGSDAGKIYYWDHEGEEDKTSIDSYENVYFIANSFEELLGSLF